MGDTLCTCLKIFSNGLNFFCHGNSRSILFSSEFSVITGLKADDISVIKAASMLSADSKERQIARLLHEIDLLKDQNRKVGYYNGGIGMFKSIH